MSSDPRRWVPDSELVSATLAAARSHVPVTRMCAEDRAWLVSGLTLAGVRAVDIAAMLGCSRRLVMTIRAEPATLVATAARVECVELERELRAERCRHGVTRQRVVELEAELSRVRGQRDRLVESAGRVGAALPRCSAPL